MGCNVKKSKKSRVSWPSDSMLCQVKMFLTEDCPAKVGGTQSCCKPEALNLPPVYDGTRLNMSRVPRIGWKRPPKLILNEDLLVASGGESSETRSENLRIAKVLEAFYPHRSLIPARPSISPSVQVESYDDSTTPNIRVTPIEGEDEPEANPVESSQSSNAPASVFGLRPDLSLAASAGLSALIKTKEQGSLINADLLVKFLCDPTIIKSLLDVTGTAKPLETGNNTAKPPAPHVNSSAMDRNSPPKPTITPPGIGVPVSAALSIAPHGTTQPPVSTAPLFSHSYPLSSVLKPLPRVEDYLKPSPLDDLVVSEPLCQPLSISTSSNWNMSRVLESARTGTDAPIRNGAYPMNVTRDDYFKNLIREHGGVTLATIGTNNYKGRVDDNSNNNNSNMKAVKVKAQKPCMFFGRARGCKLGESCLYLHDSSKRLWPDVAAPQFSRAKRLKFRT